MNRDTMLAALDDARPWDVILIGGGATGLGAAIDAAARGYRTLLLERHDFAKGTSSRSTKLVHGGVRYLKQGNLKLVREALHERGLLLRNAPHVVHRLAFVVPNYGRWDQAFYGVGLKFYDLLSGRLRLGASRFLSPAATLDYLPTLEPQGLIGGVLYYDGQFDDARLAINLAQTAVEQGATLLNYVAVTGLLKIGEKVCGVRARDAESGREYELQGRVVVNATGVWADELRHMDQPRVASMIAPSQGAHIVLDRAFLPGEAALMVPRTADGRVLFAIPWRDKTLIGTTDLPVPHASSEPRPMSEEIDFLLAHAGKYLTADPEPRDVRSVFAGLRPLVAPVTEEGQKTSSLSREHTLVVSSSGLVTITGGKWTTYRRMAQDTIDRAAEVGQLPSRPSTTAHLPIHGFVSEPAGQGTWREYGSDAAALQKLVDENLALAETLHDAQPVRAAEVVWAARAEMARTVEDVLARRTRSLFLDARASCEMAPRVAALLAAELGRDAAWQEAQVAAFRDLAQGYLLAAPRPPVGD